MTSKTRLRQSGAVSIFIVLFAALLITVITVSFSRNMIREQQQSVAVDLSQSAFDSAQAGVEDAKRVLLQWQKDCIEGKAECDINKGLLNSGDCNTVSRLLYGSTDMSETKIEMSGDDDALDQAYTCVAVSTQTDNYQGKLEANESKLIRLRGTEPFNHIKLSWFAERDLSDGGFTLGSDTSLPAVNDWNGKPPIMRTQLIRAGDTFSLDSFDSDGSKTLHLYPVRSGSTSTGFDLDPRKEKKTIQGIRCLNTLSAPNSPPYFCSASINIGTADIDTSAGDDAFLRLTAHYNSAHYEIELHRGSPGSNTLVPFDGVQPRVDSTGRANSLFRRVVSRIELTDVDFPYPEAAISISGNLCKNFIVTNRTSDYRSDCTP